MSTVKVKVNGMQIECPSDATVLEAARQAGFRIPTLCYLKGINEIGACRMCLTEVKGAKAIVRLKTSPPSSSSPARPRRTEP